MRYFEHFRLTKEDVQKQQSTVVNSAISQSAFTPTKPTPPISTAATSLQYSSVHQTVYLPISDDLCLSPFIQEDEAALLEMYNTTDIGHRSQSTPTPFLFKDAKELIQLSTEASQPLIEQFQSDALFQEDGFVSIELIKVIRDPKTWQLVRLQLLSWPDLCDAILFRWAVSGWWI